MSKLTWDNVGEHYYETGTDHGVLYPQTSAGTYPMGYAWNGLTGVEENPEGAEANPIWADNIKYLNLISAEEWKGTIKAYTYPDEFAECDGSAEPVDGVKIGQQPRKSFGFVYRTKIGNDTEGDSHGYKLHLLYGLTAQPSDRSYETIDDDPDAIEFSWECSSVPVNVAGYKPTSSLEIDSTKFDTTEKQALLTALEAKLFGGQSSDPYLPLPMEVFTTLGYTST